MTVNAGPTPQHLAAFGAVIQWFARHELLMQATMAGLTSTDLASVVTLTAGLSYSAKRDALLSLTNVLNLPDEVNAAIHDYVDSLQKHSRLRNAVAHSVWVAGQRADSVKPLEMIVRGGAGKLIGAKAEERDFTPEEIFAAAAEIAAIHAKFVEYLKSVHMIPDFVADSHGGTTG